MPLGIGAFIVGLSCAIATGYLKDNSIIKKDTIIGIVFFRNFCLDYQQAQVSGLQISLLHYGLLCMVSPTILPHEKQSELFCLYTINSSRVYCCPHHASLS